MSDERDKRRHETIHKKRGCCGSCGLSDGYHKHYCHFIVDGPLVIETEKMIEVLRKSDICLGDDDLILVIVEEFVRNKDKWIK